MKAQAKCQTTPLKAQGGYADVLLPPQHPFPLYYRPVGRVMRLKVFTKPG
ncbi:hypothetical protein X793_02215 [Dehalococcoides mccartyi CG4]|nr:hypothetical protein X793_02215 [Dehalococcoides mccartyi CG4]